MYTAQLGLNAPIAIRYPRGRGKLIDWKQNFSEIEIGKGVCLKPGKDIAVLSIGTTAQIVHESMLLAKGLSIAHYDMRFVKPLDKDLLRTIFKTFKKIITVEDGTIKGGFGSAVIEFASEKQYKNEIHCIGIPDKFINQGSVKELQQSIGLDPVSLAERISEVYSAT